jgi:hypothetical protein
MSTKSKPDSRGFIPAMTWKEFYGTDARNVAISG